MLPISDRSSRLCGKCQGFDLSSFQIIETWLELTSSANTCDFCQMRSEAIRSRGYDKSEKVRFHRERSMIYMNSGYPPVFSICRPVELETPIPTQVGFPRLPPVSSTTHFDILRRWIQHCDEYHPTCKPLPSFDSLPTRLIDVGTRGSSSIRLRETQPHDREIYVALSYLWGSSTRIYTTASNIIRLKKEMEIHELPETFQDAIRVTRELGIRYLWIDAICIIHGPEGDYSKETERMDKTFRSAYCVLAACCAQSQVDGFLKARPEREYVTYEHAGQQKLSVCSFIDDFAQDVLGSRLNSRAWVLQERAFARRTIYFTDRQTYLECGDGVRCETLTKAYNLRESFLGDPRFPQKLVSTLRATRILEYESLYSRYSRMALADPSNRPVAIAGLERLMNNNLSIESVFGVLDDNDTILRRTLLWRRGKEVSTLPRITFPEGHFMMVPSWSWMAYDGGIDYLDIPLGVGWNADEVRISWSPSTATALAAADQAYNDDNEYHLTAMARNFLPQITPPMGYEIIYDQPERRADRALLCIVMGRKLGDTNQPRADTDVHYVLIVTPKDSSDSGLFERVGVGSVPSTNIDFAQPATSVRVC